jgi:hypothetical protein
MQQKINQQEPKQYFKLKNGTRIEVTMWSKDKKYIFGKVADVPSTISMYIPITYLAGNTQNNK